MLKNLTSRINSLRTSHRLGLSLILALVAMLFAQQAYAAAQATVAWNPDSAQVAGYDVYYGTSSGNYTTTLNAGNVTSATLQNLSAQTYYIALTAYNSSNEQSGYSPELVVDSLTASAGSGGTISPSGTFFQSQGGSQTFTITPSTGYTIANVLVDGTSVGAVSSYTLSNIATNHTISATFAATPTSYTITASAGSNGAISPSGAASVNSGGSQTFNFTPATGYQVASVVVDGTAVTTASSYTFSNVTASHTISVTFAPLTYTITPSAGSNGAISPSGAVTVNYGGSQTFNFTPATGYKVSSVLVDGTAVTTASSYSFSNVTASHTISVTFAPLTYTITPSAGSNGAISPSGAVTVNSGGSQTFSFTPATGYQVSSVVVDGTAVATASSYSFSNVTASHTISVAFASTTNDPTITASAGSNGSISPSGSVAVNTGSNQTFTITANAGYHISDIVVDGSTHVGPTAGSTTSTTSNTYTFSNVTAAHTITASFGRVVPVSTVTGLVSAFANQQTGDEIAIAPGTYSLTGESIYGLIITVNNMFIHGTTTNWDDVEILGDQFTSAPNGTTNIYQIFGFTSGAHGQYTTIQYMTLGQVGWSAIMLNGGESGDYSNFNHLHVINCYEQFIKGNLSTTGTTGVTVQNCLIEFTASNHLAPCYYTGGIDIHAAVNCTIQDNILRYFQTPDGTNLPDPAIHLWDDPGDTTSCTGNVVQRNLIIDCDRGIGFWNDGVAANAGIIRNNMIYNASTGTRQDAPIHIEYCPGTQIYNNTIYTVYVAGFSYANAIEWQYDATGVAVDNNLTNQLIVARGITDGGTATTSNNVTDDVSTWFVNTAVGDLHLASAVSSVVGQGESVPGLVDDFDRQTRVSPIDVGADQYSSVSGSWYKVVPTIGSNGTILPFVQTAVKSDATQQFIVTPTTGYTASVDGTCGGSASGDAYSTDNLYTTNEITANCTVAVSLSNSSTQYTITASAGSNGSISPSGSVQVNSGTSQTFSFTPATGYQISSVVVDGTAVTTASSYSFSNVTANHTISVAFSPLTYTITPSAGSNGAISPSGAVSVNYGGSQTFTFTPATGYQVSSVVVDGTAVTTASSYSFSNVTANHTISVAFSPLTFTLTASAGSNGAISPSGAVSVNYGGSQTFSFTPATGYQISSVVVDGTAVTTASSYSFSNVTANHTISVAFSPLTYTITPSAGSNGAISPSGAVSVNYGGSQTFSFTPATGYQVSSVVVDGTAVTTASSYSFSNVTANHTISVTFAPLTFTLTASAGSNGAISPSGAVSVNYGGSQTFTFTPATGYQVSSVVVDGTAVTTASSYSFSNVTANHTISVTFAPLTFTLTASAGSNGAISPSGAVSVNYGGSQTFSFTPATGYQVSSVVVDGTAVTAASSYSFSNVTANHTISVAFSPLTFTLTASAGSNGAISPSGAVSVNYGGSQTFTFTSATGYQVSSVVVDGTAVTTASSYSFSNVTANHTISVTFAPLTFTLTASAGSNGAISPSGAVSVNYGGSQTFTFTPATGYQVSSVVADGTAVTAASSYSFSNVTANHTISVTFAPLTFTLTASAGSNGAISPSGAVSVNYGGSQTFTFTPATGYQVSSVVADGTAVTTASSYSFSNVTANHTISVTFAPLTFTLTASAGSNGAISPSGAVSVNYGGSQTFTFTPATGYKVSSVVVDGTAVTTASSYSFSNVTANHTISVTFAPLTFTLTASAGSNGAISPSGAVSVNYGGSQTFTFTPATGYQVSSVVVDGTAVTTASSYSFSNVTANHTISVTFTPLTYTLTASAGSNGAISPSGAVSVKSGGNQTFTFTPVTGYQVSSVVVDGTAVTTASSYSFSNVTANHTISVTFTSTTFTLTASAGSNGAISPSGAVSVNSGGNQTFTFTPATGYKVSSVVVDGTAVTTASSYSFSNVTANHTISVTFTSTTFTLTASAGSNGTISPSGAVTVNSGASQAFTITPATGYQVASVLVDGTSVGALTSYTFSGVTANHTISATFTSATFTITPTAGTNGTISPAAPVKVNSGASQTFAITPATGYQVSSVLVDGASVGALTSYAFSDVTANHTISASFAATNQPPVANAGPDQTVGRGVKVTLNGSNSTDVGGPGIASYLWTQTGGTKVRLSNPSAAATTFTAPTRTGALTFQLTVKDKNGLQATDTCIVNVATAKQAATVATANAGSDQTVNEGTMVTLDASNSIDNAETSTDNSETMITLNGSGSTSPNGALTYLWEQIDGPVVTLSDPNSPQLVFAAPQVESGAVSMRFRLTLTNKYGLKSTDTCFVNVTLADGAPQAVAGPSETAMAGSVVTLDGSNSAAPGCGISSYRWCQTQGSPVTLSDPTSLNPAFTAAKVGAGHYGNQLTFMLIVEGADGMRTRTTQVINMGGATAKKASARFEF